MTETPLDGWFITFEGPDGCGKTTQIKMLGQHLSMLGYGQLQTIELNATDNEGRAGVVQMAEPDDTGYSDQNPGVLLTREPGGTLVGEQIRELLHDPKRTDIRVRTEVLLYAASRAQIVSAVIRPHLELGGFVLCDRYADSTIAYQGYGRQLDLKAIIEITAFATGGLKPDLTVFLDIDVEEGLRRRLAAASQGDELNRLDKNVLEFHHRVYAGYRELIAEDPERWIIVEAARPLEEVQETVRQEVMARLAMGKA